MIVEGRLADEPLLDALEPDGRRESVGNDGMLTRDGAPLEELPDDEVPASPPDEDPPPDDPEDDDPPLVRGMAVWAATLAGTANAAATESTMSERE